MPVEIERKFLLRHIPAVDPHSVQHLKQGYLSKEPWVRIRVIDLREAELTIKGMGDLERPEFNYNIPVEEALEMWPMVKGVIEKRRHKVEHKGHVWDVDEFLGPLEGFWLAEIELKNPDEQFWWPHWVGPEVTQDPRYSNAWIAENGIPSPRSTAG